MLIQKGGISREIDERRFEAYRDKGYAAVRTERKPAKAEKKPYGKKE